MQFSSAAEEHQVYQLTKAKLDFMVAEDEARNIITGFWGQLLGAMQQFNLPAEFGIARRPLTHEERHRDIMWQQAEQLLGPGQSLDEERLLQYQHDQERRRREQQQVKRREWVQQWRQHELDQQQHRWNQRQQQYEQEMQQLYQRRQAQQQLPQRQPPPPPPPQQQQQHAPSAIHADQMPQQSQLLSPPPSLLQTGSTLSDVEEQMHRHVECSMLCSLLLSACSLSLAICSLFCSPGSTIVRVANSEVIKLPSALVAWAHEWLIDLWWRLPSQQLQPGQVRFSAWASALQGRARRPVGGSSL